MRIVAIAYIPICTGSYLGKKYFNIVRNENNEYRLLGFA